MDNQELQRIMDIVKGVKGDGAEVVIYAPKEAHPMEKEIAELKEYRDRCIQILADLPQGDPARGRFLSEQLWCEQQLAELGSISRKECPPNPGLPQGI